MKFSEERCDPDKLRRSVSNGFVFSFSTRPSDGGLFLRAPGYNIMTKIDEETTGRSTIRGIAGPIRVTEGCEEHRGRTGVV